MDTGIDDVGPFVIGDEGYRLMYGGNPCEGTAAHQARLAARVGPSDDGRRSLPGVRPPTCGEETSPLRATRSASSNLPVLLSTLASPMRHSAGSAGTGARVLIRNDGGTIAARIYYPDSLIRSLEDRPPSRGVGDENIDAFAAFVEELDHFLLVAERSRLGRPVSLLELEMHANVTKYLVCAQYLASSSSGDGGKHLFLESRVWLLWHLFEKHDFAEPDPAVQARYQDASKFARRFLDILGRETDAASRLSRLRAFHDATHHQKLAAVLS